MDDPRAQRTLVKSPPELWAEVSDLGALARHLGAFGEIRITRLEPETAVAWEGERARGTVQLEPSGWGTRVTLTARLAARPEPEPEPAPTPQPPPEPVTVPQPHVEPAATPDAQAEPDPVAVPQPHTEPATTEHAQAATPVAAPQPHAEPAAKPETPPGTLRALLRRLFDRRHRPPAPTAPPEPPADALAPSEPDPAPPTNPAPREPAPTVPDPAPALQPLRTTEPAPLDAGRAEQILFGVLDDLGAARHRPFSRG